MAKKSKTKKIPDGQVWVHYKPTEEPAKIENRLMAKWKVTFEIDLPTEEYREVQDWADFVIGMNGTLRGPNPCMDISLPAHHGQLTYVGISRAYEPRQQSSAGESRGD